MMSSADAILWATEWCNPQLIPPGAELLRTTSCLRLCSSGFGAEPYKASAESFISPELMFTAQHSGLPTLARDVLPPKQHCIPGVYQAEVNISPSGLTEFTW